MPGPSYGMSPRSLVCLQISPDFGLELFHGQIPGEVFDLDTANPRFELIFIYPARLANICSAFAAMGYDTTFWSRMFSEPSHHEKQ